MKQASGAWAGLRRDLSALATSNAAGSLLNLAKFLILPTTLSATELDLLAVGLLAAITFSQLIGEAFAQYAVAAPSRGRPDRNDVVAVSLCGLLALGAAAPHLVGSVIAPGVPLADADADALRLFCLAGAALSVLWWLAGEAQRRFDFSGVHLLNVVPNACIVVGVLMPGDRPVTRVGVALLSGALLGVGATIWRLRSADRRHSSAAYGPASRSRRAASGALVDFLALSLATQLNLVLLRVFGADLPAGSLGALYVSLGIVLVPTLVVVNSAVSALFPRWAAAASDQSPGRPYAAAITVSVVATGLTAVVVAVFFVFRETQMADSIDPVVLDGVDAALPVLALGVPFYAATLVLRSYAILSVSLQSLAVLAGGGALAVPLFASLNDSLASICAGYAISTIPWLVGIPFLLRRSSS